jgi:capsular exopolysaccharide synthesis family protein
LAFLLSLLRNKFNRYIQNQEDLEKLTTLPIYGTIPFQKQKPYTLEVSTNSRSAFTESFRTLRTNLQFLKKPNDRATTILVTSTIAGEGKTTISANLATMFEKAKYKTLLINLDIRKPTLQHFFSINYQEGISTYLNSNKSDVKEIIFATEFANLDIISSGPIVEEPSELILSKRLPLLLEELKTMYEYIIIDTAPIGIVTDTKTIMQYSDLNLIILRENYAREEFVLTIDQMIQQHEFKNVGLLLNASKTEGGEYGYGYSYEYKQ